VQSAAQNFVLLSSETLRMVLERHTYV